jgi:hypothetical protein
MQLQKHVIQEKLKHLTGLRRSAFPQPFIEVSRTIPQ